MSTYWRSLSTQKACTTLQYAETFSGEAPLLRGFSSPFNIQYALFLTKFVVTNSRGKGEQRHPFVISVRLLSDRCHCGSAITSL